MKKLSRIISGGQTGADQGGLLAAHKFGVETGGTAPEGFMTTNGPAPLLEAFGLKAEGTLQTRTKKNIVNSDATVILSHDMLSPGTAMTMRLCKKLNKPCLAIDITAICIDYGNTKTFQTETVNQLSKLLYDFILKYNVCTLNVAGNRERFADARTTHATKAVIYNTLFLLDENSLLICPSGSILDLF